jgi:inactivated superfamily I helicase
VNLDLPRIGPGEFAGQLTLDRSGDDASVIERWYRLVLPKGYDPAEQAARLLQEIETVRGTTGVSANAAAGPTALVRVVRAAGNKPIVLFGVDRYSQADWRHVDLLRSQLLGSGTKVLLSGPEVIARMENWAPNLASLVGGSSWQLDPDADSLSPQECEARLQALRHAWHQTDAEVVAMAENKQLPPEPDYAEWLVLLGRGELL